MIKIFIGIFIGAVVYATVTGDIPTSFYTNAFEQGGSLVVQFFEFVQGLFKSPAIN